ncbi:MAG: glycosyltransferase [Eubacterium sp.]|nr:glycosyltransferase [Eubacterium sp.]
MNKRISVAIATYNGEKYIEEQLTSIIKQTVPPDEIIISDDGSNDCTLEVIENICQSYSNMSISILTDNPRHGIGGNFEWAITHTTGDIIFICGQDDIWSSTKVEKVIDVFRDFPNAKVVCHDFSMIDANSSPIQFDADYLFKKISLNDGEVCHISQNEYLESAISGVLIPGFSICISKDLAKKCMPIPMNSMEDKWLAFCGLVENEVYYINEILTLYRIHDSTIHSVDTSLVRRIKKNLSRIAKKNNESYDVLKFSDAAIAYLKRSGSTTEISDATRNVFYVRKVGAEIIDAVSSSRIIGSYKLIKLYCTSKRYRKSGGKDFLIQLMNILMYSKKTRLLQLKRM